MRTTLIKIIIGILAIGSASKVYSQGNKMYLLLEDAVGRQFIANVAANGTFTSLPLVKGSYTITLIIKKDVVHNVSEIRSVNQCTQFNIKFDKAITQPREVTDSKGKHFLQIQSIGASMKPNDRNLPEVRRKLGIIAEDEDSEGLTGKIDIVTNGNHETPADWMK